MLIPDPSSVVNLILTNLILVLTSSQLSVMSQAGYIQRKYKTDMNCRNSSLGFFLICYCRNINEKNTDCFPFSCAVLLPYKPPSYFHHVHFQAAPQAALTNDEILNILTRILLVTNHYTDPIWDPSPDALFSAL